MEWVDQWDGSLDDKMQTMMLLLCPPPPLTYDNDNLDSARVVTRGGVNQQYGGE